MREVWCSNCGVIRMAELDAILSERDANLTAKKVCPVCGCPYVEMLKKIKVLK